MTSAAAFGHETESRVAIEVENSGPITAGLSTVEFQLVDTKQNKLISDADLKLSHEKILHVLVYDEALKEFRHVHPVFNGTLWSVEVDPSVNGEYFFWRKELFFPITLSSAHSLIIGGWRITCVAHSAGSFRRTSWCGWRFENHA